MRLPDIPLALSLTIACLYIGSPCFDFQRRDLLLAEIWLLCGYDTDPMTSRPALVAVIDDDISIRESLPSLLALFGFASRTFLSAEDFLASSDLSRTECVILDVAMPGMSGPDLQGELKRLRPHLPVIFATAQRDERLRTRLLHQGAIACLFKPLNDTALLSALRAALPGR